MAIFNKKEKIDWEEKYNELLCRYKHFNIWGSNC